MEDDPDLMARLLKCSPNYACPTSQQDDLSRTVSAIAAEFGSAQEYIERVKVFSTTYSEVPLCPF